MTVARNPEQPDLKHNNSALQQFKHSISTMRDILPKEIFTVQQSPLMHEIVNNIYSLIIKKLVDEDETYESCEMLDKTFQDLSEELNKQCKEKKLTTSEMPLCEGFQQILNWYHVLAREAFYYTPLEIEVLMRVDPLDQRLVLSSKAKALHNKVVDFNNRLTALEKAHGIQKPDLDYKNTDLHEIFLPLYQLEQSIGKDISLTQSLDRINIQRCQLESAIKKFNCQANEAIIEFKRSAEENRKARLLDYDSNNTIDVFNINEFKTLNAEKIGNYLKITDKRKYKKVLAIKSMVEKITEPLREFENQLSDYSRQTKHINQITDFLVKCCQSFKKYSYSLRVKQEHQDQFDYLEDGLPKAQKAIENDLMIVAKKFLEDPSVRKRIKDLQQQSDQNYEREITDFIHSVQPHDELSELKAVRIAEKQIEQLNDVWKQVFFDILNKELQYVKQEFERVRHIETAASVQRVMQLRHHIWRKADQITVFVIIDKSIKERSNTIQGLLYEVCDIVSKDKVYHEMNNYITCRSRKNAPAIPIPQPFNTILTHTDEKEIVVKKEVVAIPKPEQKPWYSSLFDQPWKRALLGCLLAVTVAAAVFTAWWLIAGISFVSIALAAGAGVVTGSGYFLLNDSCAQSPVTSVPVQEKPSVDNVALTGHSYRTILSSSLGTKTTHVKSVKPMNIPVANGMMPVLKSGQENKDENLERNLGLVYSP